MSDPVVISSTKRATALPDNYSYSSHVEALDNGRFRVTTRPFAVTAEADTQEEALREAQRAVRDKAMKGTF